MKRLVISIAMAVLPMLIFGQECFTNGTEWITKITTPGNPQTELIKIEKLDGMYNPQNETFRHSRTSRLFS
ncbi:hypothetical protein [Prevotella sp.]|uniref:hypothetical protein n=1 Tax=Prevotella sp. TaxID=59823 RepID=UPI003F7FF26F